MEFGKHMKVVMVVLAIAIPCFVILYFPSNKLGQFWPSLDFSLYSMKGNSSFSDLQDGLVHDEYYELRKVLTAASTKEKVVILATLNEAWAEPNSIYDLFLKSFTIGNNTTWLLNHLLIIAVDDMAYLRCQATHTYCYLFKSNRSSELAHEASFMSPSYVELVWERLALLKTILNLGYNFVQTDTDVMWFRDPFPHFDPDVDVQTSCDRFNGRPFDLKNFPNVGFMFVKSNNRTIKFYEFWVSSRWKYPNLHEQDAFNMFKHDPIINEIGLKIRFLETKYFGGFCQPSRDFSKVCTMHANCCVGLSRKVADLNTTIEDWKIYKSLPPNETSHPFHWRVPHICRM